MFPPWYPLQGQVLLFLLKTKSHFSSTLQQKKKKKKWSLLIFEIQFPMLLFLHLFKTTRNGKWSLK